jgi:MOSC domain-containing protein YiiM
MTLIEPHVDGVTVDEVNQVRYHDRYNRERIQKVIDLEPLAEGLKQSLWTRIK